MAFRRGGGKKKRDAVEPEIRLALRAVGAPSWQISGTGLPDLLVWSRGAWFVLEVKSGRGQVTKAQSAIPWPIVRSIDDAFAAVGIARPDQTLRQERGVLPLPSSAAQGKR